MNEETRALLVRLLTDNILPYWLENVTDTANGGYLGRVDGNDVPHPDAEKGAILNARILWAFSAAYRVLHRPEYLAAATRARDYILDHFIDPVYGGVYWSLDPHGNVIDAKKQTYAIGFTIYGMSEYARATGDNVALQTAIRLFHDIEAHAFCPKPAGYIEALTRDWQPIADMRLSDKDENGSRTMNSHLHIIEPYTNLYRVWPDEQLRAAIVRLMDIFTQTILNHDTYHLDLFFDDNWQGRRNVESYGHDIEASWLLHETALVLGDPDILARTEPLVKKIAKAADEGLQPDGSMIYEHWKDTGGYDRQRQWWVMCECAIGHWNLYRHFGDRDALATMERTLHYIDTQLVDWDHGEWHWARRDDGSLNLDDDKAGFWKCPYHNARMCIELLFDI